MHFLSIWRRKIRAFSRWALSSGAFVISMYVNGQPKKTLDTSLTTLKLSCRPTQRIM